MTFRELFKKSSDIASSEEVIELTNQFYVTLRASFAKVRQNPIRNQVAFDRVTQLVDAGTAQNWTNAYEIEQLLVHLFDDATVATELGIRIIEARSVLRPELAALYDAQFHELEKAQTAAPAQPPATPSVQDRARTLLGRLVNDLQWRYIVNEATRRISKSITRSTAALFVLALGLFLLAVAIIYLNNVDFQLGDLSLVWIAGLAGAWGATFSMLATLKSRLAESKFDDLKVMRVLAVLASRALVGAGAACILFFFLMSGLLGGTAFPMLTEAESRPPIPANPSVPPLTPTPATPQTSTPGGAAPPQSGVSTAPAGTATTVTSGPATTGVGAPASGTTQSPAPAGGTSTPPNSGATPTTTPGGGRQSTASTSVPPARTGVTNAGTNPSPESPAGGARSPVGGAATSEGKSSGGTQSQLSRRQLALLIVWCFIAGFSEQLIPSLLASTEAKAGNAAPATTDRFRPTTGTAAVPPPPGPLGGAGQGAGGQGAGGQGAGGQGAGGQGAGGQGAGGQGAAGQGAGGQGAGGQGAGGQNAGGQGAGG